MRNQMPVLTALVGVVIFLSSCSRSTVNLEYTNAKGEVQQLGNLVFRFDKALVKDSLLNQWDSTEYVVFEPKIPGRFRWEHPDELVFSPARPLPPATTFTVKLTSELLQYSSYGKVGKSDDIKFSTPQLKLDNSNVTWTLADDRSTAAAPQVDLYFNYAVNPTSVKDKLKLSVDGKPATFSMLTLSNDTKISLRVQGLKAEDKDLESMINVGKGLVPEGGVNGTEKDIESKFYIPSPYNLSINDITAEHDGTSGRIYVRTSQEILRDNLATYLKFNPSIKFSVEQTNDGFSISSDNFDVDKSYLLTINKGLRGRIGGTLRDQYDHNVAFGELEPAISFGNKKGVYLSANGNQNIEVRITNVAKVKVIISKIYENNLLAAQSNGYYPDDPYRRSGDDEEEGEDYYDYASYGTNLELGDVIYENEIDTRSLPKYGNSRLFKFNPEDRLSDFKGIYHIKIRSARDYWVGDSRFISKSDLGLIAKEAKDKIVVFANSIKTAEGLNGVNLIAYGKNNQILGTGSTNADGVGEITYSRKEFAGFRPAMIIARTAEDFNYLPFTSTRVNTSRFEVGGKRSNSTGLDAFIYPERDIYRPGEKVNFSVIIRNRQWKAPGEMPVKMKFLLPNGKELKTFRKNLNEEGSLDGEVDISVSAITGTYTLEVFTSNDILLSSQNFSIEEFVPDRIKVSTKLNKTFLVPGDKADLAINAVNFFGPPASNRNYEYEVQVRQKVFSPKDYRSFDFGIENPKIPFEKIVDEGKTDENGNAVESYSVPDNYKNTGLLSASFYATVFDETGRPVSRSSTIDIFTQDIFFGIGSDGYYWHPLNQTVRFPVIAVNKNEKVVSGRADIKVIKHEYRTILNRHGDYFRYESQQDDKVIAEQTMNISGESTVYTFVPRTPGQYEIRVAVPGANSYVSSHFYSYGRWGGDNSSFEVNTEGNIDIELDKSSYLAGETVKALFKTPFSGRMLVTMENDKLISHQYVNVEKRSAAVDLKLSIDHLPNVFITATLIKPHETSEIPLTVAHGYQNVPVAEKSRKIPVVITANESVRSRTKQKVKVKAEPNSLVSLAAVDNGVLQISGFKTPDPYNHFYASRALEVIAYDLYPLLFPELRATLSSTGGDGELEMSKRTNPMPAKRIKVVSYWSGTRKADGSGNAEFEFDVPAFSGEIRLMAVAYKDQSFGNAESAMKVADPLVLSMALPRFLSPKDTVTVPVTVTNTTSRSTSATAKINVSGPIHVVGSSTQTVSLNPNSEGRAVFQLVSSPAMSVGKVSVEVDGLGEKFKEETEISVRPAAPLQLVTGSGSANGATTQKIFIPTADFIPATVNYQLVVSRTPALELGKQFRYLVQYPYGCTEQTVSTAFPQLYYADLAEQIEGSKRNSGSGANANIIEAIKKIKMRQLYNGAITLWDDEGTEHWWASVYAAHFLLEAQKAGFEVERFLLDGVLSYLNNKLKNRETITYYYNRNQNKKIAPKEVVYSLYVLAIAGKANVPVMNYYKSNPQLLSLDSKYLLSVAYALAGDKAKFREILPASFAGEESVAQTGGSFYSDVRDEGIALNALLDVDPGNSQIILMAKHVVDKLKMRYWYSTQECAFAFLALGKMARAGVKGTISGDIRVNGKSIAKVNGNTVKLSAKQLGGTNIDLVTTGEGRLYYYWQAEGISATGDYKEEDNYIRVRRRFFDRFGRSISGNTFEQNDLVIVQISLEKAYSGDIENIVITDMIPAGFEIENPRTKEIPGMDWIDDASNPTALDVRDDRINLFVDLDNTRQYYYYAVRAVSPGVFRMGPVSADAMYNGEYHSYNGAGVIKVVQK